MFQSRSVDARARRIVKTAVDLAEKGGFEAVRLRDVAACAGVALGTLYRHFRSKEELLVAALADHVGQLDVLADRTPLHGDSAHERLAHFFAMATREFCARPMLARAVLRAAASGQPELTEKVARFHGAMARMIKTALAEDGSANGDDGSARLETMALVLEEVWFAALVTWAGGLQEEDQVITHMSDAAALMLDYRPVV